MKMSIGVAAIMALGVFFTGTKSAQALLCVVHYKTDGTGVAMKWAAMPIPYYVNDEQLPEGERAAALAAVQAAFATYQELSCSAITFEDKGKTTDTSYVTGAILVEWADDVFMAGSAYGHSTTSTSASEGRDIERSGIQLNVKYFGVGKISDKFDIQTTLKFLIGASLGFYAGGGDPNVGNFTEIQFDSIDHALNAEQMDGARYLYFNDDGGCIAVAEPIACHTVTPVIPEGGKDPGPVNPVVDGGPIPTSDGPVTTLDKGPSSAGDGNGTTTPPEDDGCCRVSHARSSSTPYLTLVGLLILVTLLRRRRK